jgi:hypothetical protein
VKPKMPKIENIPPPAGRSTRGTKPMWPFADLKVGTSFPFDEGYPETRARSATSQAKRRLHFNLTVWKGADGKLRCGRLPDDEPSKKKK